MITHLRRSRKGGVDGKLYSKINLSSGDKESRRTNPKVTSLPYRFRIFILQVSCQHAISPFEFLQPAHHAQNVRCDNEKLRGWNNSSPPSCFTLRHVNYKSACETLFLFLNFAHTKAKPRLRP
jgi:hypothetical protein